MKTIFGRKPVLEAINSGREIEKIVINFSSKNSSLENILIAAKKHGIKVTKLPAEKFRKYEKQNKNTQGVIAILSDVKYYSVEDLLVAERKNKYALFLVLDTIQDTHNLGAILRTAEASGVDGVIITENKSAPINDTVEKTSAGALSYLKIAKVTNLANAIRTLKENGIWVIGASLDTEKDFTEIDYRKDVAIIVGNEEKGIRRLTAKLCDEVVKIPMFGKIQSLNVSVATGILLYEVIKQRQ